MTTPIERGWSAADVLPGELVSDAWIAANTRPGRKPSRVRALARRVTPAKLQSSGLTRDQMRRICVRAGLPYTEAWSAWNRGRMTGVWGALCHHTGTPASAVGDYPTLRVVRDGRSDLQNSLCAFGLGRSGRVYLISEKLSWHAGAGNINGLTDGNGKLVGIEAESDGTRWTPEQVAAYPKLVASILVEINQDDKYTTRHATYALPAGRKNDFAGWPGGTTPFWHDVYRWIAVYKGQTPPTPPPPPAPAPTNPGKLTWALPSGHYYGNILGPTECHGGATAAEKTFVRNIQRWLIYKGCVSGIPASSWATAGWADGVWGTPTDTAMINWHNRFYAGQPKPAQCWKDDYDRLATP